jgi:hypothetical protein
MVDSKGRLLYDNLLEFYGRGCNLQILLSILKQRSSISLRILDWLVTNYARSHNVYYPINRDGVRTIFFVYQSYKNQLKAYSKKHFDPFCRRNRITLELSNICKNYEGSIVTTIGQLNFFRWFIEYRVLNYVMLNIRNIDEDMNNDDSKAKYSKGTVVCVTDTYSITFE